MKQRLRLRAATHKRSMEAEARAILTVAVADGGNGVSAATKPVKSYRESVCQSVRGIWKGRMTTDEIMKLTRGD